MEQKHKSAGEDEMIFEYMVPSSSWTHTADTHCLLIHLPGFKKEEVRLRAGKYGRLEVSGERQVNNENKIIHFQQAFTLPPDSAIEETTGILEDGTFYITIPKKKVKKHKKKKVVKPDFHVDEQDQSIVAAGNITGEHKTESNRNTEETIQQQEEKEDFHDTTTDDEGSQGSTVMEKLSIMFKKNGTCTVVMAFSLGVVITAYLCKFKNNGK